MANDITTLAIEIQSAEAERNLRTFNELLISSSQPASKMDKVRIGVDVEAALLQLQALRSITGLPQVLKISFEEIYSPTAADFEGLLVRFGGLDLRSYWDFGAEPEPEPEPVIVDWKDIVEKPDTFTPSDHTHGVNSITDGARQKVKPLPTLQRYICIVLF